ncbi:MAG: hypothetical protein QM774_01020 [Gordonia sp. (in: high G+C Gram-positive bacteria)]|uniref:hypothetical protein n=1 Tax=Gordonia sp. (in: high G+C Gram-positive bacteria) TaxID=84139 RepID=UPI0039E3007E
MTSETITLTPGTAGGDALGVARSVLESHGYLWVPQGPDSAVAHEGGEEITRRRSRKLRIGVTATPDALVLAKNSTGAEGFAAGVGALTAMRVTRHFRRACRAVRDGLEHAGLA